MEGKLGYNGCMKARFLVLLILAGFLAACQVTSPVPAAPTPGLPLRFTPYHTATGTPTPTPTDPATPTPLPSPTPTPRTHVVREGDDMFGIAYWYGITLEQLKTLNPTVNPNAMGVGTVLLLPNATPTPPTPNAPGATTAPLVISQPVCYPTAAGGLWCFALVKAPADAGAESVSATFRLVDISLQTVAAQAAYLPLDVIPAGASLPLAVHFAPPLAGGLLPVVELASALPLAADDPRYLDPVDFQPQVSVDSSGNWAEVSGTLALAAGGPAQVRLLAVAYDSTGQLVGFRRWDDPNPLSAGSPHDFILVVYSAGPAVHSVQVAVEILAEPVTPTLTATP